jgi:putative hydrolase of the HAD superfamily
VTVEAVLLDWGGTVTPHHDVDLADLWRLIAGELAPGRAGALADALVAAEWSWWRTEGGRGRSGTVTEVLAAASAAVGLDVSQAAARAGARHDLARCTPHTLCDPEALLLVHLLLARGLRVGLLTNTHWPPAWHARLLRRDGLLDLFHARVYTSDLPFSKPHPGAFHAALAALGVADPRAVVYVGDRPVTDIAGAHAVGMRTVLLADGAAPRGETRLATRPDAVIGRLGQLLDVMDALGAPVGASIDTVGGESYGGHDAGMP